MLIAAVHESVFGTKRTSLFAPRMSAIGGKADMRFCTANVCFWPKADMASYLEPFDLGQCRRFQTAYL